MNPGATLTESPVNPHQPWSALELDLLRHYQHSLAISDALLNQINRSPEAIKLKLKRMNQDTPAQSRRFWTTKELKFLADHADKPLSWLAAELHRSIGSVQTQLDRQGRS